ncbi:hypothetical protein [Actinophytocola sp.]|uniref:hypothetical protein n=1 Tax=Actinophytocola sp. TaxID=1872138 RepID=UPI002D7ECE9B|nr:hypothetical protein [Actinophytocola sp.]HET9142088.1 hypothetical protein [Actinophytocola sp.]
MFALQPVLLPLHRTIVVVDIEGSTTRTNPAKAWLRQAMYSLLEQALEATGIVERHRDRMVDRGDGVLLPIHPVDDVPKTLLLTTFIPRLSELVAEHNGLRPEHSFRLRAAVHAGEIHYDNRGPFGEAIDVVCRLVDAPELKDRLRKTDAVLVLAVSDDMYRSVIRHGYDGIDDRAFEPSVRFTVGEQRHRGWVHVPGDGQREVEVVRQRDWLDDAPYFAERPAQYGPSGEDHRIP